MGGVMIWKVLWDYHKKIENMMNRYSLGETQLLNAIVEEIEVYTAVEEEVVHPGVEGVARDWVEVSVEANDRIKDLAVDIQNLDPGDPDETRLMKKLRKIWNLHTEREEKILFPIIKSRLANEQYDMARQAFTVRQEL